MTAPPASAGPAGPAGPTHPTHPDWAAVKAAFERLADLAPAARAQALAHETTVLGDAALQELHSLLLHHDDSLSSRGGFLDASAAQALVGSAAHSGQRLGAWLIVRPLGAGGMGEVFEAERADGQYQGRAAVKLLKRGMDSAAVLQRFALERQALARLSHPHIARLLDAGASDQGLPYFVLEFVDGRPIDQAVQGLALAARLGLFLQLADAVAHAHRNLLVHRDLKPGNVLVDGQGQVKLLDFGIAKALDPLEAGDANATAGGVRPYTPHYASPEQVRGEPVGTATDIYSLGVLLYQMLTGLRPTGQQATTPAEAARCVLEDQPTRPSQLSPASAGDAAVDPLWWQHRKRLAGDLDNILLKALEKGADQRYASVDAMAADLRAFLGGFPVSARAPSAAYVAGKFVRRHRVSMASAVLAVAAVMVGSVAALHQARRAEAALADARAHVVQLRQLSRDVVVEYGDAITYLPDGMARKAAMLQATVGHLDRLAGASADDPAFQAEVGALYARLADLLGSGNFNATERLAEAERHAMRALALFDAAGAPGQQSAATLLWWAKALAVLGRVAHERGALGDARQRYDQADALLAPAQRRYPADAALRSQRAATLMLGVQVLYGYGKPNLGQPEAALAGLQQAATLYQQAVDSASPPQMEDVFQRGTVAGSRALILARQERWPQAQAAAREAITWRRQALALEPHNRVVQGGVAADLNLLGGLCLNTGDAACALQATQEAAQMLASLRREDPANQAWRQQAQFLALNLGRALLVSGQPEPALAALQVAADWLGPLVAQGQAAPMLQRRWAQTQLAQAGAHQARGRPAEALVLVGRAAQALQALVARQPQDRDHWLVLGECAATLAGWAGQRPASAGWRDLARTAYGQAHRLAPLTAEHARRAADMGV